MSEAINVSTIDLTPLILLSQMRRTERNWREEQNQLHWDLIWYFAEMSVDWSDGTSVLLQQYPPEVSWEKTTQTRINKQSMG